MLRPVGTWSSTSRVSTSTFALLDMSTTGEAPVTVTDSSRAPTSRFALNVAVKSVRSSTPSNRAVLKPGSENVTV